MEDEGQRTIPLPALREQRLEVFVTDGVGGHADIGQFQEQLLFDVARDDFFG